MLPSIIAYNQHMQLYQRYLTSISGVKLTFREVDIIACIMHNRGEKKIAHICGIFPTTVSTHTRNIMGKVGCNSKEQIIDFVEKSGTLKIFREYYLSLLIKSNFEKALEHIGSQVNRKTINCYCSKDSVINIPTLYQTIKTHLKKANINLLESSSLSPVIDLQMIQTESYYQDFFHTLSILIGSGKVSKIEAEFEENLRVMYKNFDNKVPVYIQNELIDLRGFFKQKKISIYAVIGILVSLIIIALVYKKQFTTNNVDIPISNQASVAIQELEKFLSTSTAMQFTANNTSPVQGVKNQSTIKVIEKILFPSNIKEVQDYFNSPDISSEILMKYLHIMQALSSYYLYNEHDGNKARNILLYLKNLAENYINSRSKVAINFNQITDKELLSELRVADHLPQLYARILYSLGRSYMYNNDYKELEKGKAYFKMAKNLSQQLNLFEGYMSELNGIIPIEKRQLELLLKTQNKRQSNIDEVQVKFQKIISLYQQLKQDNNIYILDYDPSLKITEQQTIKPCDSSYNLLYCESNIINIYKILIEIDYDNKTKTYIDNIITILSSSKFTGLLQTNDNIAPRRKAFLYNELGNILLILNTKGYKDRALKFALENSMLIKADNNIHLAEQLFEQAKSASREIDHTKADALDGLIKVYKLYIELNAISAEQEQTLLQEIEEYTKKRDFINKTLQRVP